MRFKRTKILSRRKEKSTDATECALLAKACIGLPEAEPFFERHFAERGFKRRQGESLVELLTRASGTTVEQVNIFLRHLKPGVTVKEAVDRAHEEYSRTEEYGNGQRSR